MPSEDLSGLVRELRARVELDFKRDIQKPAALFGRENVLPWAPGAPLVKNGDDAAAIQQADGSYLLFATDGMRAEFIRQDPWFAGYSAVMVNVSDIAAMGGRPQAIVDVVYLGDEDAERLLLGMQAASTAFGVPIVGGHTCRTSGPTLVSCAIVGRAETLLESSAARPGEELVYAVDLRGAFRTGIAFNAATTRGSRDLRAQIEILPRLAESDLATAAKDVSNAGLLGTVAMLLESSGAGASIELGRVPAPPGIEPLKWLMAFPSFGYVLSVPPSRVQAVCRLFRQQGVAAESIGTLTEVPGLVVRHSSASSTFWEPRTPLTGWGNSMNLLAASASPKESHA